MADREILKVEIDDSAFTEFKKKFEAYSDAVKALPGEWQKSGTEIVAQKSNFEAIADSIRGQAQELVNLVSSQGKINAALDGGSLALAGMARSGKQFAGHIFQATASLRHWTKLTAVFSGLIGAGGLFGINRMAMSVARNRTGAIGLGVSYGEQASFLANFGRLGNAAGILQGFSEAETDVSKQYALRQYLGHGGSGDPAKDFAEGLSRFKTLVDSTPKELLGPALRQRGYDRLGLDTETALAVKGMSRGEIEQIGRGYGADLATRLGLPPDVAKKWTEFTTKIEKAGEDIETILWKGTGKLAKPFEDLSLGFEHLVSSLMRDGGPISGWVKDLGEGLHTFADTLGNRAAQRKAAELGSDVAAVARLLEAIVSQHPRGLAVLLGMASGAELGGAAAAIGGALAGSTALGALGAGAAVVGGGAALGAAVEAGANKLDPAGWMRRHSRPPGATQSNAEDERARQERFRGGGWQGPRQEGAQGPWQGPMPAHPMPKGVFPKMAPAKPGSLSGKQAVEFESANEPAPMGPGMGRYNFMHGQFGGPGQNLTRITTSGGHTVTVNKAAAPHFLGFINELERSGAPIHQNLLWGYNDRNIAGRHTKSQHAYGNAVDIDSHGRNIITPDFAAWARTHDKELHEAERRWGIRAGRDMSNPDMGHWEWGGGEGSGGRRASFGHMQHRGHHPATVGRTAPHVEIELEHGMVLADLTDTGQSRRPYEWAPHHRVVPQEPEPYDKKIYVPKKYRLA